MKSHNSSGLSILATWFNERQESCLFIGEYWFKRMVFLFGCMCVGNTLATVISPFTSFEKMTQQSDLIVIAKVNTRETSDDKMGFFGVNYRIEVEHVLKGDTPDKTLIACLTDTCATLTRGGNTKDIGMYIDPRISIGERYLCFFGRVTTNQSSGEHWANLRVEGSTLPVSPRFNVHCLIGMENSRAIETILLDNLDYKKSMYKYTQCYSEVLLSSINRKRTLWTKLYFLSGGLFAVIILGVVLNKYAKTLLGLVVKGLGYRGVTH